MQILVVAFLALSGFGRGGQVSTEARRTPVSKTKIGCIPGKQLVFDVKTSQQQYLKLNPKNFSCVDPDPAVPCFYYKNLFYPSFLIQDLVSGETYKFEESYILKIIGGGPYLRENIRLYSPGEILKFNSQKLSSQKQLMWTLRHSFQMNKEGFIIMHGNKNFGIRWLCNDDSPCTGVIPEGKTFSRFYFVFEVSNRLSREVLYSGAIEKTYLFLKAQFIQRKMKKNCHYSTQFEIIVHTLPMNLKRKVFNQLMSILGFFGVLVLYCLARGSQNRNE